MENKIKFLTILVISGILLVGVVSFFNQNSDTEPFKLVAASHACPNTICELSETYANCPLDCQVTCGNQVCEALENCPTDCDNVGGGGGHAN